MKVSKENLWFVIILLFVLFFSGGLLLVLMLELGDAYSSQSNFQGNEEESFGYPSTLFEKDALRIRK